MNQQAFEKNRRDLWDVFENELKKVESLTKRERASDEEKQQFIDRFERISKDLAMAKSRGYSIEVITKLNDLVKRGHYIIHNSQGDALNGLQEFFTAGFPREVRQARIFVLVSLVSFVVPGLVIGALIHYDPSYVTSVLSPSQAQQIEQMYAPNQDRIGRERSDTSDLAMFGFYIANNTQIGLTVFISGVFFCIFSIYVLGSNGLLISAALNHLIVVGLGTSIFSFVSGHSAFELTAIVLSGAAGIMIGYALIHPGNMSRKVALYTTGKRAIRIAGGAAFMFFVAAFIEAFWSSIQAVPAEIKYVVGIALWIFTLAYFMFAGKGGDREAPDRA